MTSEADHAFVWLWLPDATEPVVAGRLDARGDVITFNYGQSFLRRADRMPLFLPELPLVEGVIAPLDGMRVAGVVADAGPDDWGQRVIMRKRAAQSGGSGERAVGLLDLLLASGSDRTGALDFQESPTDYAARASSAPLEDLLLAAQRVEEGLPFRSDLEDALVQGSSLGGARPKVHLDGRDGRKLIAKFARPSDRYPVVRAEGMAMELARRAGLDVAPTQVIRCLDSDVLLVDRFDRIPGSAQRRMIVSALTIEHLDERWARYATYTALAEEIRIRFTNPKATLRELFARIAFNICVGNTDDHARNHAAFWDGATAQLTLTPAFDLCPQPRAGGETVQAMGYGPEGERRARLHPLIAAAGLYQLRSAEAEEIVDHLVDTIRTQWADVADLVGCTAADRSLLWGAQFLNPSIFFDD